MTDKKSWDKLLKEKEDIYGAIKNTDEYLKNIVKLDVAPVKDPFFLNPETPKRKRLLTNTALDRVLSIEGGIEEGSSLEVFGAFASGKTQIVNTMLIESDGLCILIDSEGTFREKRFRQHAEARGKDIDDIIERLLLYQPNDWMEQDAMVRQLPEFNNDGEFLEVGIVAVDSILKLWGSAPEFFGRQNLPTRQMLIGSELAYLQRYCRRHKGIFIFTNQVRNKPIDTRYAAPEERWGGGGGPTVQHVADYRILLRKGPRNIRYARTVDSVDLPLMEVPFILDVAGIRDIPDPAERVKAFEIGGKYGTKFLSAQVSSVPAAKKYYVEALRMGAITVEDALENKWLNQKQIDDVISSITVEEGKTNIFAIAEELEEIDKILAEREPEEVEEDE